MTKRFDKIIIGSSPIGILEGYFSNNNEKILIVDRSNSIGGCWREIKNEYLSELNYGCHSFYNSSKYYDFLREELSCQFYDLEENPKNFFKNIEYKENGKIDFLIKNFLRLKFIFKNILILNFKEIKKVFQTHKNKNSEILIEDDSLSKKEIYLKKGINDFIRALKLLLKKRKNIKVNLNENIEDIKVNHEEILIQTNKENYKTKKLIITSNSDLDHIKNFNFFPIDKKQVKDFPHLLLVFKDEEKNFFQYNFFKDKFFTKINNYTGKVKLNKSKTNNEKIFVLMIWYKRELYRYLENKREDIIIKNLKKRKIISNENNKIYSKFYNHKISFNSLENLKYIKEKTNGKIDYIETSNLKDGILSSLKKWKK